MADTVVYQLGVGGTGQQTMIPIRVKDNGDGSFSPLTSSAGQPTSLGQKTPAGSTSVVEAQATPYSNGAVTNTKIAVKGTPGALAHYHLYNPDASNDAYLQIFDAATIGAVTLGTTPPTWSIKVPAGGILDGPFVNPLVMAAGIVIAATTTYGGLTAPVTALVVNLGYL